MQHALWRLQWSLKHAGTLCVDWQPPSILVWNLTSTLTYCTCNLCRNTPDAFGADAHWEARTGTLLGDSLIWLQASQHRLARSSAAVVRRDGARLPSAGLPSSPPGSGQHRGGWAPTRRQPEAPGSTPSRKRRRSQLQASSCELKAPGSPVGRAAGSSRGNCKAACHAAVPSSGAPWSHLNAACTGAVTLQDVYAPVH